MRCNGDYLCLLVLVLCFCASVQREFGEITPANTGTTIVGCLFDGGVVLGADTRATRQSAISNKRTRKIHRISDAVYCCGAGVAADAAQFAQRIRTHVYKLQLQEQSGRVGVSAAAAMAAETMANGEKRFDVGVIMGGMDPEDGGTPRLFQFSNDFPCGIAVHSCAMGSGMLAANAVLDSYQVRSSVDAQGRRRIVLPTREEAVKIVSKAVLAGIHNDLGSGSNVDLCIIDEKGATVLEPYIEGPAGTARASPKIFDDDPRIRNRDGSVDSVRPIDTAVLDEAGVGADIGELLCSRRRPVRKLAFSRGSATLHLGVRTVDEDDQPFASVI